MCQDIGDEDENVGWRGTLSDAGLDAGGDHPGPPVAPGRATDVAAIVQAARARWGCISTARHRGGKVVLKTELERLGVLHKRSRPYHPTRGKIELST